MSISKRIYTATMLLIFSPFVLLGFVCGFMRRSLNAGFSDIPEFIEEVWK